MSYLEQKVRKAIRKAKAATDDDSPGVFLEDLRASGFDVIEVDARENLDRVCPDDGTCHHDCSETSCFRVAFAAPLSGVYRADDWPDRVKATLGKT